MQSYKSVNGTSLVTFNASDVTFHRTWALFRASPLYNFVDVNLNEYSASLFNTALSELVLDDENLEARVQLVANGQPSTSQSIVISLKVLYYNADGDSRSRSYTTVLYGAAGELPSTEFSSYPLLLSKGPVPMQKIVFSWLARNFDCTLAPLMIPQHKLVEMFSWGATGKSSDADPVELTFAMPSAIKGMNQLTVSLPASVVATLHHSLDGQPDRDHALLQALYTHFYHFFHISLSNLTLTRVGTPTAYVAADGKFRPLARSTEVLETLASLSSS